MRIEIQALVCAVLFSLARASAASDLKTANVSFSRDIAPILLQHCQECHGPKKEKANFRIDTFDHLMKGGESKKAAVVPGKAEASELYRLISTSDEDDRMPKKADPLPREKIETVRKWIEQGAKFDGDNRTTPLASLAPAVREPDAPKVYTRPIPITAIAFSPDGKQLAISGYHEVSLWEPLTGKLVGRIGNLPERTWGIAWSTDGKLLATAGGTPGTGGGLYLCDPRETRPPRVLERISDMMLAVRFSPNGKYLAAGGADSAIRIYEVQSGHRQRLIEQHADWVTDLAFSPDGTKIASASRDKSARIFDVSSGAMLAAYLNHTEGLLCVAWSEDGKRLFTGGLDRAIHCWRASDGKAVGKPIAIEGDVYKLEVLKNALLCCASDGSVRQYSPEDRKLVRSYCDGGDWTYCLSADQQTRLLAVGSYGGQVRVWNIDSGKLLSSFLASPAGNPSHASVGASP